MGILLFLAKPLFYVVAFVVATYLFRAHGPHWKSPTWLVVVLATAARLVLGVPGGFLAVFVSGNGPTAAFAAVVFGVGLALWFGVAKVAFRRAPLLGVLGFALVAELVSGSIDYLAWQDVSSIRFC